MMDKVFPIHKGASIEDKTNFIAECARIAINHRPGLHDLALPDLNPLKISELPALIGETENIRYNVALKDMEVFLLGSFNQRIQTEDLQDPYKIDFAGMFISLYFNANYNVTFKNGSQFEQNKTGKSRTTGHGVRVNGTISMNKRTVGKPNPVFANISLDINAHNIYTTLYDTTDADLQKIADYLTASFKSDINGGIYKTIIQSKVINYLNTEWASRPQRLAKLFKFCRDEGL